MTMRKRNKAANAFFVNHAPASVLAYQATESYMQGGVYGNFMGVLIKWESVDLARDYSYSLWDLQDNGIFHDKLSETANGFESKACAIRAAKESIKSLFLRLNQN